MNKNERTYIMFLVKKSTKITTITKLKGGWFSIKFCSYFIIDLLMQHKFRCVNLMGRSWSTWKSNRITPKYLLYAKMYLVALGFWSGFGKPCDSDYYTLHSKSMKFLDLLHMISDKGIPKFIAVIEDHPLQHPGRLAPVLFIPLQSSNCSTK